MKNVSGKPNTLGLASFGISIFMLVLLILFLTGVRALSTSTENFLSGLRQTLLFAGIPFSILLLLGFVSLRKCRRASMEGCRFSRWTLLICTPICGLSILLLIMLLVGRMDPNGVLLSTILWKSV
jgi:hypothetical protein